MFVASRGPPAAADQSSAQDGVATGEHVTYRRGAGTLLRDDRYPALLPPGVDKPRNSFISDDVEKLYDFTATVSGGGRDPAFRAVTTAAVDFTAATTGGRDPAWRSIAVGVVEYTRAMSGGRDPACRIAAAADYAPAVERAASTVDVGGGTALALYHASSSTLGCPLCVQPGGSWSREAVYVERRPRRRDHDVDCLDW